jgi:hypothetical protein
MLASAFKTAAELGITERVYTGALKVLGMLERGEVEHADHSSLRCLTHAGSSPQRPFRFNMGEWIADTDCGTVCCIGGAIDMVTGGIMRGTDEEAMWDLLYVTDNCGVWGEMKAGGHINQITVPQAAQALRNFLTTGKPSWRDILPKDVHVRLSCLNGPAYPHSKGEIDEIR